MNPRGMMRRILVAAAVTALPLGPLAAVEPPDSVVAAQRAALQESTVFHEVPAVVTPATAAPETKSSDSTAVRGFVSDHVVVVSIDGLRPDAIRKYNTPNLRRLMAEGSFTMEASTIMPSKTLPSHTSMLTGTEPEQHGVTWNSEEMEEHGHIATPTIFAAAKQAGFHTAAFFSKTKFEHLAAPGTLDHVETPSNFLGKRLADNTVGQVEKYLKRNTPNLLFVHIGEPDFVGHIAGWMSSPYGWAVEEADDEVGDLLKAADKAYGAGNYTVIVTADHGGHGRDHGSDDPRDVTIPWIVWGQGVRAGEDLGTGIRTMDTAATALWLLGVEPANAIAGHAVAGAFSTPNGLSAATPE